MDKRTKQRVRTHLERRRNIFIRNTLKQGLPGNFVDLAKRGMTPWAFQAIFTGAGKRWAGRQLWRRSRGLPILWRFRARRRG